MAYREDLAYIHDDGFGDYTGKSWRANHALGVTESTIDLQDAVAQSATGSTYAQALGRAYLRSCRWTRTPTVESAKWTYTNGCTAVTSILER